jgi:hypothetical protein
MTKLRDVRFRKTNLAATGQLEFDQDMLTLLMAINEEKTLLQVAKEIKMKPAVFKECFLKIYKLKLVEEVKEKVDYVDGKFLRSVREILVELLGPLGEVLMEDAAEKVNTEMPHIPKNNIAEYVQAIATEIPGDKQRTQFQKFMLEKINSME